MESFQEMLLYLGPLECASSCLYPIDSFWKIFAGFGPIGTLLLVSKLEGGLSGDVVGFGLFGICLLMPSGNVGLTRDVAEFGALSRCCWIWSSWDTSLGA